MALTGDGRAEPASGTRRGGAWLWVLALLLMLGAAVYQRRTGPTYPLRASFVAAGVEHRVRLPRSGASTHDAQVAIPDPGQVPRGVLRFRRFPTGEAFREVGPRAESVPEVWN